MNARKSNGRRQTGVVWGVLAEVTLGGTLFAWTLSPTAADRALFGAAASIGVLVAAMLATAAAIAVVVLSTQTSWARRWGVALPVSIIASGVGVLALGDLFATENTGGSGFWILLAFAAVGMNVASTQVAKKEVSRGRNPRINKGTV